LGALATGITLVATSGAITPTSSSATTIAAPDPLGGHQLIVSNWSSLQLQEIGPLFLSLRSEDFHHLDAIEMEIGFDPDDVTDLGALVQQRSIQIAFRLLCSGGPPGPASVITAARQFYFDPSAHGEATSSLMNLRRPFGGRLLVPWGTPLSQPVAPQLVRTTARPVSVEMH
jgi:hypothetical protein